MQYHQPGRFARTMKALVSLLWSSSLLRRVCSQWLMLSSESPKGPSSYSVLPEEAIAQDREWASQMGQLRRTSRTCKKIGTVSKEKTIACTEEKKTKTLCEYHKNSVMPRNMGEKAGPPLKSMRGNTGKCDAGHFYFRHSFWRRPDKSFLHFASW